MVSDTVPVSNVRMVTEVLLQSSDITVTWTVYFSPHLSIVILQLVDTDVQLRLSPEPSVALATYEFAPNTWFHVTVAVAVVQSYCSEMVVTGFMSAKRAREINYICNIDILYF